LQFRAAIKNFGSRGQLGSGREEVCFRDGTQWQSSKPLSCASGTSKMSSNNNKHDQRTPTNDGKITSFFRSLPSATPMMTKKPKASDDGGDHKASDDEKDKKSGEAKQQK
jgi:hypothetical protein